jgi:hypothetical protein
VVGYRFGHIGRKLPLKNEWPAIDGFNFWSACVIYYRIAESFLYLMSSISCRCDDFHVWADAGILHSGIFWQPCQIPPGIQHSSTRSWRRSQNWQNMPESVCRRRNLAKFWHDISRSLHDLPACSTPITPWLSENKVTLASCTPCVISISRVSSIATISAQPMSLLADSQPFHSRHIPCWLSTIMPIPQDVEASM